MGLCATGEEGYDGGRDAAQRAFLLKPTVLFAGMIFRKGREDVHPLSMDRAWLPTGAMEHSTKVLIAR